MEKKDKKSVKIKPEHKWLGDGPPDHINELGVKWWFDKSLTNYAQKPDVHGTTLPNATVWLVEESCGRKTRVLVVDGSPVYDNTSLEAMGCQIDWLKASERFK